LPHWALVFRVRDGGFSQRLRLRLMWFAFGVSALEFHQLRD
jgi:hypothetical protein